MGLLQSAGVRVAVRLSVQVRLAVRLDEQLSLYHRLGLSADQARTCVQRHANWRWSGWGTWEEDGHEDRAVQSTLG